MTSSVLIADPDSQICDLFRRSLVRHGFHVRVAEGGIQCIKQLHEFRPDLLVLDLDLFWGGADGVLAVMRDDPLLRQIPVVVTMAGGAIAGLDLSSPPVVRIITKPFPLPALLDCVVTRSAGGPTAQLCAMLARGPSAN